MKSHDPEADVVIYTGSPEDELTYVDKVSTDIFMGYKAKNTVHLDGSESVGFY